MIFNDTSDTSAVDELWFIQTAHEVPNGRTNAQRRALLELHATRVVKDSEVGDRVIHTSCLLYTSPSPRDRQKSRMPSSA